MPSPGHIISQLSQHPNGAELLIILVFSRRSWGPTILHPDVKHIWTQKCQRPKHRFNHTPPCVPHPIWGPGGWEKDKDKWHNHIIHLPNWDTQKVNGVIINTVTDKGHREELSQQTWTMATLKTLLLLVQSPRHVWLFVTPWTAALWAPLFITNSQSLLKLMFIESVMPSNHVILCCPLLLPSVFSSIRVFFKESVLHIRWPKDWSFSFSINPSKEYSGLISFKIDWLDLLVVQGTLKSLLQHHKSKASVD